MRDDLESIMYMVIIMVNSYLPWFNLKGTEGESQGTRILKIKEEYWGPKLTEGLPQVFQNLVNNITEMDSNSVPEYDKLIDMLMVVDQPDDKGPRKMELHEIYQIQWNCLMDPDTLMGHIDKTVT